MFVVVQNDPEVPAGTYGDHLRNRGVPFETVRPYAGESLPDAVEVRRAIVLGGAMGVCDTDRFPFLAEVKRFIGACVQGETPFLGICLGGQLLADVLGGKVTANSPYGEKGTLPVSLTAAGEADPLFAGLGRDFITFQWHNDSFAVPPGGVLLASSAACQNQAFRYGRNAYGTQFHPEVNGEIVAQWVRDSAGGEPLRSAFAANESLYRQAALRLLINFLAIE